MSNNQNSSQTQFTKILNDFFTAINTNDISEALKFLDPQIERIEFEGRPLASKFRGYDEIKQHLSKARDTWAEGCCQPERFLVAGDKVIVFLHARVRLKDKTDWIDGRFADVFMFSNGKITNWRSFWERQEALDWVGVQDLDAN